MTVKEVATLLRVSPQTLYKMLEQGVIPAVKVGSQWRFDRNQIREWLKGQTSTSNGNAAQQKADDEGARG